MTERFTAALVQMTSGTEVADNIRQATALIREAAAKGGQLIVTPENTTQIEPDKARVLAEAQPEATHPAVPAFSALANELGRWLLIGSLTVGSLGLRIGMGRLMLLATMVWYTALAVFAQTTMISHGFAALFIGGFFQSLSMVSLAIILLRTSEARFRGRIMGVRMLAIYSLPLGLLVAVR